MVEILRHLCWSFSAYRVTSADKHCAVIASFDARSLFYFMAGLIAELMWALAKFPFKPVISLISRDTRSS